MLHPQTRITSKRGPPIFLAGMVQRHGIFVRLFIYLFFETRHLGWCPVFLVCQNVNVTILARVYFYCSEPAVKKVRKSEERKNGKKWCFAATKNVLFFHPSVTDLSSLTNASQIINDFGKLSLFINDGGCYFLLLSLSPFFCLRYFFWYERNCRNVNGLAFRKQQQQLPTSHSSPESTQGCQICLGTIYQNKETVYQMTTKLLNDHKITK
jgi:hypothetical protein